MIALTQEEKAFLLEILDQVSIRGIEAKLMIVSIMGKLAEEAKVPASDLED